MGAIGRVLKRLKEAIYPFKKKVYIVFFIVEDETEDIGFKVLSYSVSNKPYYNDEFNPIDNSWIERYTIHEEELKEFFFSSSIDTILSPWDIYYWIMYSSNTRMDGWV